MVQLFKISGIILVLFLAGCTEKDELTLPVNTHVTLVIQPMVFDDIYEDYEFDFTGGMIGIQKIEFEGIREAGENVFFETDPEMNLPTSEFNWSRVHISDFDLPQGVYRFIRFDLHFKPINEFRWDSEEEEYTYNSGLLIEGWYKHFIWNWDILELERVDSTTVVIAIDSYEKFVFRSLDEAVLKQPEGEILLLINLKHAFKSIDFKSFEEAEISGEGPDRKIIISSKHNTELYEILLYRLGLSTGMVVR